MKFFERKKKIYLLLAAFITIVTALSMVFIESVSVEDKKLSIKPKKNIFNRKTNPHVKKLVSEYEDEIEKLMKKSNTPGASIIIVRDSTVVYIEGFGVRASNDNKRVDENTVFRIASVSKCFASFLTGILIEDSLFRWNDPIIKYVPDFSLKSPEQTQLLTVANVLSHTTGLPYHTYTNLVEEGTDLETMLGRLKEVKLSSAVGKEYSYQNVAYSLIANVVSKTTGKTYEQMMREKVFVPLGMKNASIDYQTFITNENIAKPHRMGNKRWVPAKITDTYYNVSPAGGINASAYDMAQWMIALLGHREHVVSKGTLEQLYAPFVVARSKNRNYGRMQRLNKSYYGLGWRILHYPNDTIVYHGGYVNGYRSEVALDPKDDIAVCILANAPGELADNGIPIFFNLYNTYRDSIQAWDNRQQIRVLRQSMLP